MCHKLIQNGFQNVPVLACEHTCSVNHTTLLSWCGFSPSPDVPPLEDMSEYLEKAKELKSKLDNQETVVAETLAPKQSCATKQNGTAPSELNSSVKGVAAKKDAAAETFGGLKKGFLFGSVEKQGGRKPAQKTEGKKLTPTAGVASSKRTDKGTTGSSSSDDIPFIKPQDGAKSKGLEFPEVQEAMKESYPLLRSQGE